MSAKHEIHLWGALRPHAGGASSVFVEAATIGDMFSALAEHYPGMETQIERGIAVSVNGVIYRDQWDLDLPLGAEVYLMPRIAGG